MDVIISKRLMEVQEEEFMDIKSRIRFSMDKDLARNIDNLNELVTFINKMPDDKHKK